MMDGLENIPQSEISTITWSLPSFIDVLVLFSFLSFKFLTNTSRLRTSAELRLASSNAEPVVVIQRVFGLKHL
jgi:hypothetical protein